MTTNPVGAPAGALRAYDPDKDLLEAFLAASRALVAVAARSLAELDGDVTLTQYHTLVVLNSRGPQRTTDLAAALNVTPSTASRMIERLVGKRLVRRARSQDDRRTVRIFLTDLGRSAVTQVSDQRRGEIEQMLDKLPARGRRALTLALRTFAASAGEVPEPAWATGWDN